MKKALLVAAICCFLAGCGAQKEFETVSDVYAPEQPQKQQVVLALPQEASTPAFSGEAVGELYLCNGYVLTVQTLLGGNLDKTFRELTGFSREALRPVETLRQGVKRYDCVFTSTGEGENQINRVVVLDDGTYHYAVSVMAGESQTGKLAATWQKLLDSVTLRTD